VAAHPAAFGILILYAALWYIFDRDTLNWHAVTTLIVWFMTLLIQRAEQRDTQAIQAKLDELLHAQRGADSSLTRIDESKSQLHDSLGRSPSIAIALSHGTMP
jgi:low affinity Fe/Cu permease